ncbi:MAG: F0F1 ATP synthase subunit delta [Gammaproteobacteria bacterium]|nr:F0F1 ATP synthase subunit delta [Gammaproteobacteria bacterium]
MELNWSTFFLEIINFLVLVWILKRFLYHPVLDVLEKRREKIEQSLDDVEQLKTEATSLHQQYQRQLNDLNLEKQHARETLLQEIETERTQRLEQLQTELASEREKAAVIEQRQQTETLRQYEKNAHQQGARFAARLLNNLASPELEQRLFDLLIKTLDELDKAQQLALLNSYTTATDGIMVTSAYALSDEQRQQLESSLSTLCKQPLQLRYQQDPELLAGLRIVIGAWVLRINIQDELGGFAELGHENPIS